jgi:N4-gp56 family major capsid protein
MTTPLLVYGDITPRTAAYAVAPLLKRHDAKMVWEKFGQTFPLPTKSTIVAKFRRYEALPLAITALVEGVSPGGTKPTITDYTATLSEYGDFIPYSGFMLDTHEDPILKEFGSLAVQQAAESVETVRYNIVKAGSNVGYANGSRSTCNTPITLAAQRVATAALHRQRAEYLTDIVSSSPDFRTEPIEAAFVAIGHPDITNDVRNMQGFISVKQYNSNTTPFPNEIGAVDDVRYIRNILCTPFLGSGSVGGAKGAMRAIGDGVHADVYPVIYVSKDAYGIVPLKGTNALALIAHNPGSSGTADPLNQRGTLGWKTATTVAILNDLWIYRLEVAVTA